jgi:hypothetical protein
LEIKDRIPNVEELRDFAVLVKKSDISIEQCAEGYRMKNLMNSLGITDDINDIQGVYTIGNSNIDINSNRRINYIEFSSFVKEIYMNCKRFGIKPDIIFSWIIDLFSWYSPSGDLKSFVDEKRIESGEERNDQKPLSSPLKAPYISQEAKSVSGSNSDEVIINPSSDAFANNITEGFNPKQNTGYLANPDSPFISKISNYIAKKKKECIELENYKRKLEKDTKIKESKKKSNGI